ncbi:proline-rich protein 7-like [Megalops cyprinoides]|uniref:proline-rich protein 7-like n=1 Tax=Megalops cyprinoides TaxID=118141 RepID=UPI001864F55C|nr:proline-rich protein 7-like [Megalops cyprinoides]
MVMSQGTYTFLTCFAGFWLVWALVVMLCCFCSFLQRRLKRRREGRLRERSLRVLEMPPPRELPQNPAPPPAPPPVPPSIPQGSWIGNQEGDVFGKPPCYEDAVLMEDPPPPYSEVLADPRGGTYGDLAGRTPREPPSTETSKTAPDAVSEEAEQDYPSLIHLPASGRWDSLGRLLSTMELNCNNLPPPDPATPALAAGTMPAELRLGRPLLERTCPLPTAFPVFGRSTAV